jgi:hypothetical protein
MLIMHLYLSGSEWTSRQKTFVFKGAVPSITTPFHQRQQPHRHPLIALGNYRGTTSGPNVATARIAHWYLAWVETAHQPAIPTAGITAKTDRDPSQNFFAWDDHQNFRIKNAVAFEGRAGKSIGSSAPGSPLPSDWQPDARLVGYWPASFLH